MKKMLKAITCAAGLASTLLAVNANAATVSESGIVWDTINQGGIEGIAANFNFQQWYTNGNYGMANGVPVITASSSNASELGAGVLTGLGKFTLLSDGREEGSSGFGTPGVTFCTDGPGQCELTFAFGGLVPLSQGEFDFSNAWLNVYYDGATASGTRFGAVSSTAYNKYDIAQDGNLWASFSFDNFIFTSLSGDFTDGQAYAELSVTGGDAFDALNYAEGGPDIEFTSASQFETQNVNYSTTGSGNITSVSAPSTVAFFGLALMGIGAVSRRKLR